MMAGARDVSAQQGGSAFSETYALSFDQFASGASSRASECYEIEDTIEFAAGDKENQASGRYEVVSPLGVTIYANNGIATGMGTKMFVNWNNEGQPQGSHFNLYRSPMYTSSSAAKGRMDGVSDFDFVRINKDSIGETSYTDYFLDPETIYVYKVELVTAEGETETWCGLFYGTTESLTILDMLERRVLGVETDSCFTEDELDINCDGELDVGDIVGKNQTK